MGFSIWDRTKGGPATNKRYQTDVGARRALKALQEKHNELSRFYIKPL